MTRPSSDVCGYCGLPDGHSKRCSVTKWGVPELREPNDEFKTYDERGDDPRWRDERDHWKRMFNRLDAAITHHKRDAEKYDVPEIHDEALWAARDRILQASADPAR